jgi:hypothetical protein
MYVFLALAALQAEKTMLEAKLAAVDTALASEASLSKSKVMKKSKKLLRK